MMNYTRRIRFPTYRVMIGSWLAVMLVIAGCATPYKPRKRSFGYFDYRIAPDVFAVSFKANASTNEETAELYLLRRASELTLEHGFDYFLILSEKGRTRSGSVGYSGFKLPVVAPGSAVQIRCFEDRPPAPDDAIDAREFLSYNFPDAIEKPAPREDAG